MLNRERAGFRRSLPGCIRARPATIPVAGCARARYGGIGVGGNRVVSGGVRCADGRVLLSQMRWKFVTQAADIAQQSPLIFRGPFGFGFKPGAALVPEPGQDESCDFSPPCDFLLDPVEVLGLQFGARFFQQHLAFESCAGGKRCSRSMMSLVMLRADLANLAREAEAETTGNSNVWVAGKSSTTAASAHSLKTSVARRKCGSVKSLSRGARRWSSCFKHVSSICSCRLATASWRQRWRASRRRWKRRAR